MIRAATHADAGDIAGLWNDVIALPHVTFTTDQKTTRGIVEMIEAAPGAFWVAEREGQFAGFARYGAFRAGPGYAHTVEHTVMVTAQVRGRGIGAALMGAVEAGARRAGMHVLVAGISSGNASAQVFHARMNFVPSGRVPQVGRKAGQWYDLILMHKLLNPS